MAIKINVGGSGEIEKTSQPSVKLNARKSLDGNLMIMSHSDIDIVVIPDKKKIILFPKNSLHDQVYSCQERFFNYMAGKGVIKRETIQSGDVYGSMQAEYPDAVGDVDATQMVIFVISKFMVEEGPYMEEEKYREDEFEEKLTDPDEEESTELGEVPHAANKGSIQPDKMRRYMSIGSPY